MKKVFESSVRETHTYRARARARARELKMATYNAAGPYDIVDLCGFMFFLLGRFIFPGSSTGLKCSSDIKIYSDHFPVDRENPHLRLYCNFGMK